jgi:hypothetical protein
MKPIYDTYELIDRYLNNELSSEERMVFHSRLVSDAEFAETFELQKLTNELIIDRELIDLEKQLAKDLGIKKMSSFSWGKFFLYFIGAALVTSSTYYFIKRKDFSKKEISHKYINVVQGNENAKGMEMVHDNSEKPEVITSNKTEKMIFNYNTKDSKSPEGKSNENYSFENIESQGKNNLDHEEKSQHLVVGNPGLITSTDSVIRKSGNVNTKNKLMGEVKKVDCSLIKISANSSVEGSCRNKATGSIVVDEASVFGGTAPYSYSINGSNYFHDPKFLHLAPGKYALYIKDLHQCISVGQEKLEVKEIECLEMISDAFAPSVGETWKLTLKHSGSVQIITEQGTEVYSAIVRGSTTFEWDGRSGGASLPPALYQFVIHYDNGEIEKGYITILN